MPQQLGWFLFAVALASCGAALADEEVKGEYGHLRGRFVYDGEPPEPKPIKIVGFEKEGLEKLKLVDESLVVNDESHGLANVVVYLHVATGEAPPAMHPSYRIATDAPEGERMKTLRSIDTRFVPHVLLLRTDEILLTTTGDMRRSYNAKLDFPNNPGYSSTIAPSSEVTYYPRRPERVPGAITDNIYPWMRAWALIQDHPYMAATDADGRFEIRNIPVGERTFRIWHEKSGFVSHVKIDDREVAWEKGLTTLEIRAGETIDLGDVQVPAQHLE